MAMNKFDIIALKNAADDAAQANQRLSRSLQAFLDSLDTDSSRTPPPPGQGAPPHIPSGRMSPSQAGLRQMAPGQTTPGQMDSGQMAPKPMGSALHTQPTAHQQHNTYNPHNQFTPPNPETTPPQYGGMPDLQGGGKTAQPAPPQYGNAPAPRSLIASSMPDPLRQWWDREETVTKVLAILGGLITLIGLVFLATLAYSVGILGPESSVILAGVLCVGMFASAFKAHSNQPRGSTAPALIVVAVLGGLADLWVAVFKLHWFSEVTGSVLTTLICIAGLAAAYKWQHETLAVIVTALSPLFICPVFIQLIDANRSSMAIPGCIAATALAAFAARWGRAWVRLHATASVVFTVGIMLTFDSPLWTFTASALGVAILMLFSYDQPTIPRPLTVAAWFAFVIMPVFIITDNQPAEIIVEAALFGVVLMWGFQQHGSALYPPQLQPLADNTSTGFYITFASLTTAILTGISTNEHVLLFGCAGLLLAALGIFLFPRVHVIFLNVVVGLTVLMLLPLSLWILFTGKIEEEANLTMLESLALLAIGAVVVLGFFYKRRQLPGSADSNHLIFGLFTIVVFSAIIPAALLSIAEGDTSFMVGHLIISVAWIIVGLGVMSRGDETWTKFGLVMTLVAVAKLVAFDLSVLGGIVQVLAFIISGALLLFGAFNRERLFAKKNGPRSEMQGRPQSGPQGWPKDGPRS